jgi:preprotein translocase subunit YajC
MKNKIIKQLKIYVPGYLVLMAIGTYFLIRGPQALNDFHNLRSPVLRPSDLNEDTQTRFWIVAPYFSIFLFLLSSIFLAIFYFRSVRPLVRDIKKREKMAVFYKPKKTAMTLFNRYYITIPLYSNQQIEINKTDFDNINEGELLCLEMGPCSHFLLNLKNNEKNIRIDDLTL